MPTSLLTTALSHKCEQRDFLPATPAERKAPEQRGSNVMGARPAVKPRQRHNRTRQKTRQRQIKPGAETKPALAYRGLTPTCYEEKIPRTPSGFVGLKALNLRASQATVTRILAYDVGLPDLCLLLDGVDSSFRLVPVKRTEDAIEVIAREMGNQAWSELAILCHGAAGKLNIGRSEINTSVLLKRREELETLNINTLSLYSCNTGCDSNFLQTLSNIMGTHVFASSTQVGAQSKGGSWELGVHATPSNLFSSSIPEWNHVLSTITISPGDTIDSIKNSNSNWASSNYQFASGTYTGSFIIQVSSLNPDGLLDGQNIDGIDGSAHDIKRAYEALSTPPSDFNSTLNQGLAEASDITFIGGNNGSGTIDGSETTDINGTSSAIVLAYSYLNANPILAFTAKLVELLRLLKFLRSTLSMVREPLMAQK